MNRAVCIDASAIVALLVTEKFTASATARWKTWIEADLRILAPALLGYEVTSVIYRKVINTAIDPKDCQAALQQFVGMDIEYIHLPELHLKAITLASQFNRPNTYDAHYLAVADHFSCPLWTADERLYNTVRGKFDWIKWIEEIE
ncbi:MAG: type II toxin-antitoxin system VapC family toxin [Chloroflexi bacterium]|nr:type II toxin-antitoxin system VapC family toxin [Chloroflexota bacterium]